MSDGIKNIILTIPKSFTLNTIFKLRTAQSFSSTDSLISSEESENDKVLQSKPKILRCSIHCIMGYSSGHYVTFSLRTTADATENKLKWHLFDQEKVKEVGNFGNVKDVMIKANIVPLVLMYKLDNSDILMANSETAIKSMNDCMQSLSNFTSIHKEEKLTLTPQ